MEGKSKRVGCVFTVREKVIGVTNALISVLASPKLGRISQEGHKWYYRLVQVCRPGHLALFPKVSSAFTSPATQGTGPLNAL